MFAQRVQAPQRKVSAPVKDSSQSESAKIEGVSETLLVNAPAYSYSIADVPALPPSNPRSDPPPAKPAPLPGVLPSNLAIGAADDSHESKADKAAGRAVSPWQHPVAPMQISGTSSTFSSAPPIVHQVLNTPGQPLHSATRAFFEPRFGYDFSRIRVHTDAQAEASADAIQARAYTSGNRIVFASGQYGHSDPDRTQLLAHELAHVIQQDRPRYSEASYGNCEQDAENAAASIVSGNAAAVRTSAAFGTVQRQPVTNPTGTPATQKISRLVRIERYWRSPSARAIFADGSTEEVTFVKASSLDPADQPAGTFEKEAKLTIDRSSAIRPYVEFAPHSSGSKVKVVTRLSPADRISKLPPNVRGELSESFLSDTENGSNPETMEFVADMGDRLKETSGTTKIEMEGRDPATLARMQIVDQWVQGQQKTIDKLGPERRAKFTKLLSDIRTVGVTGPNEKEDLNAQEIELVLAGAAGGQSEFTTFSEFKRGMDRKLHSKEISIPEEMADNPDFFIRNEYRKAWKTEAAGLNHMSRIASAAQAAPFIAIGASAAIGGGLALTGAAASGASDWLLANGVTSGTSALEVGGEKAAEWFASQGISSSMLGQWAGSSLLTAGAINEFGAARDEAKSAGIDPNSPSGIASTVPATILRTLGIGQLGESVTNTSIQTGKPLNRDPLERIVGGIGGTLSTLGTADMVAPNSPSGFPAAADSSVADVNATDGEATVRPEPNTTPDLNNQAAQGNGKSSPGADLNVPGPHPFFKNPAANENITPTLPQGQVAEVPLARTGTDDSVPAATTAGGDAAHSTSGANGPRMGPKSGGANTPARGKVTAGGGSGNPPATASRIKTPRFATPAQRARIENAVAAAEHLSSGKNLNLKDLNAELQKIKTPKELDKTIKAIEASVQDRLEIENQQSNIDQSSGSSDIEGTHAQGTTTKNRTSRASHEQVLGANAERDGSSLPLDHDRHHIAPKSGGGALGEEIREILRTSGVSIDDKANLSSLAGQARDERAVMGSSQGHQRVHTNANLERLRDDLRTVQGDPDGVRSVLQKHGQDLYEDRDTGSQDFKLGSD